MEVKKIELKKQNNTYVRYDGDEKVTGEVDGIMYVDGTPLTGITSGDREKDYDVFNKHCITEQLDFTEYIEDEILDILSDDFTFYKKGCKYTGEIAGIVTTDGIGSRRNIKIVDGKLFNGVDGLYLYKSGIYFTGIKDDLMYKNGTLLTGVHEYKFYHDGVFKIDTPNNRNQTYNGMVDDVYYYRDQPTNINDFSARYYRIYEEGVQGATHILYTVDYKPTLILKETKLYYKDELFTGRKKSDKYIKYYIDGKIVEYGWFKKIMLRNKPMTTINIKDYVIRSIEEVY